MKGMSVVASVLCAGLAIGETRAQSGVKPHSAIVILGDGTPLLSADRSGTSIGIVVRGTLYVFDAGPAVLRRIQETRERLRLGIQRLGPVFVTHLHSDHTLGLPELLYYPDAPSLRVYGPPGIRNMLRHLQEAWADDRHPLVRRHAVGSASGRNRQCCDRRRGNDGQGLGRLQYHGDRIRGGAWNVAARARLPNYGAPSRDCDLWGYPAFGRDC